MRRIGREIERKTETVIDGDKQRKTGRDTERPRQTDRQTERQTERER